jgi:hypothetical protein
MEDILLNLIPMGDEAEVTDYWRIDVERVGYTPGYVQRVGEMEGSN